MPTLAEIKAELERRKAASAPAMAGAPVAALDAEAIRAELERRKGAKAPPASMAPAAKAPPASVGTGAASMGIGAGFANPARIVPISPLKPGASEYRPEIEGYKGKQFPTNWPKGMAAPPMPPQGYSWQDTGYSYDLRQDAPKDFVSMSPAQLRQMREEQAAAAHQQDLQRKSNETFEMQDGSPLYMRDDGTLAQPVEERPEQVANLADTNLGVRVAKNALNTAGPGTINAGLDMAEMAASNVAGGPAMRAYAAMQNQQEQPRITFGAENASKPQPQDMRLRVPELPMQAPEDGWQAGADVVGQLAGFMATPGQATEAALKATGATNALMRFAPQGSSAAAKAGRYGARILNPIDDVAHAAAFGAVTAEDGKTAETALQYATDPINYIGRPIASLLYRGGIALDSLGKRVTPEAIELERAMSLLNGPNPTAAQVQEAAQIIDRLAPADATPSQPTTSVPTFTRPQAEPPPVQPQAAAQAAPQAPPVQAGVTPPAPPQPPVAGPTMAAGAAGNPPGVSMAQAAQTPPPGTLTISGNGVAVDSFNALPVKTREGLLRAMEASGMTRQQAFDAIRSLNDLPPDRANMFMFELIRRYGGPDQFPNLQANLTAMGSDFAMQTGRKGGSPQEVMNKSLLDQAQSEGEYLIRMAEDIFGEGKVATKQELDAFRNQLGGQYRKQLEQTYPGLTRLRSPQAKLELQARIDPARKELTEFLLRPEVMEDVPQWVRDQVMLQVSDDLRFIRLDDAGQQFRIQQNPELAPLLTPERTLRYSPQLWKTLVEMYPTQVAHSLQSAYRQAIDEAYSGISNAVDRTTAKRLKRMRGESRVRANAADPNKRGYGLLHLLEQASPGYKDIRQQFGDVVGAQKAADMPNTFFRIAKDEEALANFIDVYDNELTPLQQEAVRNGITTQIRQALKNKTEFTQPWELDAASRGNLPNLTAVSSQPFLEALPRVFGRDGERMADAIRLSRANIDNIQAINKNFASGTPKGTEIQKNARNLYENPSATNLNPIDATTSTLSGVGALSAMTGNAPLSAAVLGGAAARALYRAYKNGKSLTPGQREALAEWLFKPRRATDAPPPTTPRRFSNIGYAGNVLTGAGVGAGAAAATGQDPTAGAVAGALGGGVRAGLRAMRAERSIIKPPPAGGRRGANLRTGGNPPPAVGPAGAPQIVQNGWFGGGKKPPRGPKAPPGAGPRNVPVQRSYFAGPRGNTYEVTIEGTGRGAEVNFRPQGGDYASSGNMSLAEVNDVFRNVEKAIRDDIATNPKPRYVLEGATKQRRDIYEQIAKTRPAPEGYRWEMVSESGRRPYLTLTRSDAPPPASAPKPPPVKNGFGSSKLPMDKASRMQRAREQGFDVYTPLYHGTASDFEAFNPKLRGLNDKFADDARLATFFSTSPDIASQYADEAAGVSARRRLGMDRSSPSGGDKKVWDQYDTEKRDGAAVMPVYARLKNPYVVTNIREYDADAVKQALQYAEARNHDGVIFKGMNDAIRTGARPGDVYAIFDPSNIRGKFAAFDPSQSGSSKLLAGMADNATGYGTAGGAIAGGTFARDTNGDGIVDANERAAGALGGAITGGIAGKAVGAGVRRIGKAPPVGNKLKGGKAPPKPMARSVQQNTFAGGPPLLTKPAAGNKHGLEPSFREVAKLKAGASINKAVRPPVTKAFTPSNADKQLSNIDRLLADHPAPETSSNAWSRMMADMVGDIDAPIPPYQFLKDMKNGGKGAIERLKALTPEQIAEADHGFHQADEFRKAYISGDMQPTDTTKLFMWSFLSRGVSPYVQESMFLDAFKGADEWIQHAVNGTFDSNVLAGYKKWASEVSPAGSGLPGSGTQHNLNAFGEHFLRKMAQRADDGETYLKKLHDMIADPNMTGPEIRRAFSKFPEGIGIDNKVISFTLLASGRKDVMVLDRIQVRALFNDGRFGNRNIYDPLKKDGAAVAGTALADITYGAHGIVLYEAIERALAKRVDAIYAAVGRPQDASIGRYHWDTWNGASGQEASHGTLGAILNGAKRSNNPLAGIRAKEGEYGSFAYNSEYGISADGERTFHYTTSKGTTYEFSVPAYREFIAEVKKAKNGVVPPNFKVTQSGNAPWTSRPEINADALDALAARYADRSTGERAGRRSGPQSTGGEPLQGNVQGQLAGRPKRVDPATAVPTVRRPPVQNGFIGRGNGPKAPPKVILEKRVANRLGKMAPALSEKTRDAIRANAGLPHAMRKSAYEASGYDPALIEVAAPFMTGRAKDVRGKAPPLMPKPKNRLTSLDRGVHSARANAARAPDYPPLDSAAELRYRTENARRGAKSAVTRWENENYDFDREAAGLPQRKAPADKRQRLERQAETAALADRMLKQMKPTADDVEWLQRKATRRLREIDDAIQRGQMSPDFATAKPRTQAEAKDMARMIFEAEYADLLDDVLSGRVTPKARSEHALAVFLASSASIGAVGGAMALADINAAADRQRQARDAAKAAKEEDMSVYREPTDPRFVWDWEKIKKTRRAVQTIQANLNALPPNSSDGRFNLSIDAWGPKTETAVKRWQFENGFKPTGELTKEQWDLLDQQATEARQATR